MKKSNSKGFFLSETMIVITIVTIVLLGVFKIFSSVYTKYKDSENYNTVNATIVASSLKNYYKSVGIDYVTLLNGSYYVDLTNSSTYDNEYYDYLKQTLDLDKVYLIDMTQIFTGTNINVFNTSLRKYIRTLEDNSSTIMLVSVSNGIEYGSAFITDPATATLVGDSNNEFQVTIALNGTFTDPGYTNWDGDAPITTWEKELDTSVPGTYYLVYNFDGYLLRRRVVVTP